MAESLGRYRARRLTGDERLPAGASVSDFWRWIGSDLVGNTTRGIFAEYLVGLAVGRFTGNEADGVRDEWALQDIVVDDVSIEVKASAYLQTWGQGEESRPQFDIKARSSEIYVFCLLHHTDPATLNPLDLEQWTFYVVPTATIDRVIPRQQTIRLGPLEKKLGAKGVSFDGIAGAVREAVSPTRDERVS